MVQPAACCTVQLYMSANQNIRKTQGKCLLEHTSHLGSSGIVNIVILDQTDLKENQVQITHSLMYAVAANKHFMMFTTIKYW